MFYNFFIYLVLFFIGIDVRSSSQIRDNQIRSSVSIQTGLDDSVTISMNLLNINSKRVENLSSDQLFILRNLLVNSNNFNIEDSNILSNTNYLEFAIMARQLNIVVHSDLLFNQGSTESLNSFPEHLQNNPIRESHIDSSSLSSQNQYLVG